MCGLVGYSGKKPFNQKTIELLIAWNSLERGEDATGLYSPINGLKKTLTRGSYYTTYKQKDYFVPDKLFIGHVRAATIGSKDNVDNAHPFKRGPYVLAHNGTLKNHRDLLYKYNLLSGTFVVDSDCVAGSMEACNDIATVLSEINGAGAFIIHDERKKDKLYLFRNKERPLWRAYDDEGGMYLSSLPEPLAFEGLSKIKEFKEDVVYSITNGVISTNRSETRNIKNTPYSRPANTYHYNHYPNTEWPDDEEDKLALVCGYPSPHRRNSTEKNKPIYPLVPAVNNDKKYDIFENLWLKCIKDISYYNDYIGRRIELKAGEYYLMASDSNIVKRLWLNENDEDWFEVDKVWFDLTGMITKGNLVCLLNDNTANVNSIKVGDKGDIFEVTNVYPDSDISLKKHGTSGHSNLGYVHKRLVRKLTNIEKEQYLSEVNGKALGLNSTEDTHVKQEEQKLFSVIGESSDEPFDADNASDFTATDSNVQIIVNEKGLHTFFKVLEDKLRDLRNNSANFDTNNKLTDIINFQITEKDKLINNGINV